jgi:hypothetical protein
MVHAIFDFRSVEYLHQFLNLHIQIVFAQLHAVDMQFVTRDACTLFHECFRYICVRMTHTACMGPNQQMVLC